MRWDSLAYSIWFIALMFAFAMIGIVGCGSSKKSEVVEYSDRVIIPARTTGSFSCDCSCKENL